MPEFVTVLWQRKVLRGRTAVEAKGSGLPFSRVFYAGQHLSACGRNARRRSSGGPSSKSVAGGDSVQPANDRRIPNITCLTSRRIEGNHIQVALTPELFRARTFISA